MRPEPARKSTRARRVEDSWPMDLANVLVQAVRRGPRAAIVIRDAERVVLPEQERAAWE